MRNYYATDTVACQKKAEMACNLIFIYLLTVHINRVNKLLLATLGHYLLHISFSSDKVDAGGTGSLYHYAIKEY